MMRRSRWSASGHIRAGILSQVCVWVIECTTARKTWLGSKIFFWSFVFFLGLHLRHMEVCRLEVESELQLLAYTTATATRDLSWICNLHRSSRQCQILNPPSRPGMEPEPSWILDGFVNHWATMGTSPFLFLKIKNVLLEFIYNNQ